MNLLRRAAIETVRALGINVPTALTVILGLGLSIVIVPSFSAPETDSGTGFVLWLLKTIAWLTTLAVVFVPLLAWNTFMVARREKSVSSHLKMAAESAALDDEQMKSFLRNALRDPWYGVAKCYAFGSVVGQYPTGDIDIIIQFDSSKQDQVRTYRDRLRNIESNFQGFYDLKLHVQTFLSAEDEALHRFLNDAGVHEQIM